MKQVTIGIPKALLYYRYAGQWSALLDHTVSVPVYSPETSAGLLRKGIMHTLSDLCLPVKTFLGHVAVLKDEVDTLFIPRYVSVEQESFLCPKLIGLPDVVRASFSNLPPIIAPMMHYKQYKDKTIVEFVRPVAKMLSVKHEVLTMIMLDVSNMAGISDEYHNRSMSLLSEWRGIGSSGRKLNVGIVGRPYLLFDKYLSKDIFECLRSLGVNPIYLKPTAEDTREAMTIIPKWIYWDMGKEVVTAAHCFFRDDRIHGVINLCSATCGPDSFTNDLIKKRLNPWDKPYMSLSIDEHTSDVGLHTRIEAFIDMIRKVTI